MPSVELHLWVRELTRIDREAAIVAGVPLVRRRQRSARHGRGRATAAPRRRPFPGVYCRHCGRSGWGVALSPANSSDLDISDDDIRRDHATGEGRFRALLWRAPRASRRSTAAAPGRSGARRCDSLRWFHVAQRQLLASRSAGRGGPATARCCRCSPTSASTPTTPPARTHCPACQQRDGIRFLGSAIATQLSVALSTLFGSTNLDQAEKKTLVFTDSVQDAAHRAGFVQSRSHSLTLRSVLREAVGDAATSPRPAGRAGHRAGRRRPAPALPDPAARPRREGRVRAVLAGQDAAEGPAERPQAGSRKRLRFDAVLEFGLQSRLGRTLELTGTVAAEVEAAPGLMLAAARQAVEEAGGEALLPVEVTDDAGCWPGCAASWSGCASGARSSTSGSRKLIEEDGSRYFIWGGRPRSRACPPSRSAGPPRRSRGSAPPRRCARSVLDPVTTPQSWYAQWAARVLQVTPAEGATLARLLLKRLAAHDVLTVTSNKAGAEVYAIPQASVVVEPVARRRTSSTAQHLLVCAVCQAHVPGTADGRRPARRRALPGRPGAPGASTRSPGEPDNFYRRFFGSPRGPAGDRPRAHLAARRRAAAGSTRTGSRAAQDRPQRAQRPRRHADARDGHRHRRPLDGDARLAAAHGRVVPAARRPGRPPHRQRAQPRLRLRPRRAAAPARRPAVDDQRRGAPAGDLPRRRGDPAPAVPRLARRPSGARGRRRPPRSWPRGAIGSVDPGSYLHALAVDAERPTTAEPPRSSSWPPSRPCEGARASALRDWVDPRWRHRADQPAGRAAARGVADAGGSGSRPSATGSPRSRRRSPSSSGSPSCPSPPTTTSTPTARRGVAAAGQAAARRPAGRSTGSACWRRRASCPTTRCSTTRSPSTSPCPGSTRTPASTRPRTCSYQPQRRARAARVRPRRHVLRRRPPGQGRRRRPRRPGRGRPHAGCSAPPAASVADVTEATAARRPARGAAAPAIADVDQRFDVVELTRVSSAMRRDEAVIDDAPRRAACASASTMVVARRLRPGRASPTQWYVEGYGFGAKHVRDLTIRWLNLGRAAGHGSTRFLGGRRGRRRAVPGLRRVRSARQRHRPQLASTSTALVPAAQRPGGGHPSDRAVPQPRDRGAAASGCRRWSPWAARFACPSWRRPSSSGCASTSAALPTTSPWRSWSTRRTRRTRPTPTRCCCTTSCPAARATSPSCRPGRSCGRSCCGPTRSCATAAAPAPRGWPATGACCRSRARARTARLPRRGGAAAQGDPARRVHDRRRARPGRVVGASPRTPCSGFDPESKMEQKFRAVLKERLDGARRERQGVSRATGAPRWRSPSAAAAVALDPQVNLLGSKPDFVLRATTPQCRRWRSSATAGGSTPAPCTTGWPTTPRSARILRDDGFFVLGLSWADLEDGRSATRPWFDRGRRRARHERRRAQPEARPLRPARGDRMDLLMALDPGAGPGRASRAIGDALPFVLAAGPSSRGSTGQRSDLLAIAGELLDGSSPRRRARATRRRGPGATTPLVVLSRLNPKNKSHRGRRRPGRPTRGRRPGPQGRMAGLAAVQQPRGPAQRRDDRHRPEPASPRRRRRSPSGGRGAGVPGRRGVAAGPRRWRRALERDFLVALSASVGAGAGSRGRDRRPPARAVAGPTSRSPSTVDLSDDEQRDARRPGLDRSSTWTSTRSRPHWQEEAA